MLRHVFSFTVKLSFVTFKEQKPIHLSETLDSKTGLTADEM